MNDEVVRTKKIPARRNGMYYIEFQGKKLELPSVTTILGETLPKRELTYWAQRETAKAVYADPSISLQEALAAPYQKSRKAMDRGSRIHSLAEAYFKTGKVMLEENIVEFDKGSFRAIKRFFEEERPQCMTYRRDIADLEDVPLIEITGFNLTHKFAGTIDFVSENGDVYDWKTGKAIYKESHYQQAAYMNFEYLVLPDKTIVKVPEFKGSYLVHIRNDGGYAKIQCKKPFEKFLVILNMYREVILDDN